jgi:DNA-binding LytR/AlgR family response regulator
MSDAASLQILIADDEALARRRLKSMLEEEGCRVVAECASASEVLAWLAANPRPDALFLDIQMPGLTGLELVPELEDPPPIVFVTAFVQYAVQAFDAAAVDYLVKPVAEDRLRRCLERLRRHQVPSRKGSGKSRAWFPAEAPAWPRRRGTARSFST